MNKPPTNMGRVLEHRSQALSVQLLKVTLARAGPKKYCNLWGVSQGPGAPPGCYTG